METQAYTCPNCGSNHTRNFFEIKGVPVHSVLLIPDREEAINFPKRDIQLTHCQECDFVWNAVFDPTVHSYSTQYEETQGFSPTFRRFHEKLAKHLIERYDLHDKDILEIGCGKGEFLTLLCEMGNNRGVGIDPAYVNERNNSSARDRMTFIQDFYSDKYRHIKSDFVCCKMTLEHIPNTAEFIDTVHRGIEDQEDTIVFFQIPDATRVFREYAFWDIYYEHCSYFSQTSLTYLFEHNGFDVLHVWTDYDDQYLMIEAKPEKRGREKEMGYPANLPKVAPYLEEFAANYRHNKKKWDKFLDKWRKNGEKVVLWGAGSKGVAFLTSLKNQSWIRFGVDINPYKFGTFLAGTGQEIVGPKFLKKYQPDVVIVMNPVYTNEISEDLRKLNLKPKLIAV